MDDETLERIGRMTTADELKIGWRTWKERAEAAEVERDALREKLKTCDDNVSVVAKVIAEVMRENAELRQVLEMVEWVVGLHPSCPWCNGGWTEEGSHSPDCPRQKVLGL